MRGRGHGRGAVREVIPMTDLEVGGERAEEKGESGRPPDQQAKEEKRSWMNIITSGAQLTLDVMRVIREATDLYRKLRRGT